MSDPAPASVEPTRARVVGIVLFLLTLALYWPVHDYEFITLDDGRFVEHNPRVNTGLTADNLKWAFTSAEIDYWRPLSWLSHQLDVELFGMNAGRHHLTSVFLHALNVVLLFAFVLLALRRLVVAALVAALFAWHPIHVESVAWIAERKDVLCGLFWIGSLILYTHYARTGRRRWLVFTGAAFAGGIMCKPMIITLPFQLLLLDLWPLNRLPIPANLRDSQWRRQLGMLLREKAFFFLLTAIVCIWTFIAQKQAQAMTISEHVSIGSRAVNAIVSYARYLKKLLWPNDLAIFYPYPESWPAGVIAGCALLLLALTVIALRQLRTRPFLFVGWFWFLGTLMPVIGLVQVGSQAMADRYAYTPAIGLYLAVVYFACTSIRRRVRLFHAVAGGVLLLLLLVQCRGQIRTWQNNYTVYSHAIEVVPGNWLPMNNLANALSRDGRWDQALPLFAEVARLFPGKAESFYNLALAQAETGDIPAAIANHRRALQLDPDHADAHYHLGVLLSERAGQPEAALSHFRRALELRADFVEARYALAMTHLRLQQSREAIVQLEALLSSHPEAAPACIDLARIHSNLGNPLAGLEVLERGLSRNPDNGYLAYNAASFAATLGDWERAARHLQRALAIAHSTRDAQLLQAVTELRNSLSDAAGKRP